MKPVEKAVQVMPNRTLEIAKIYGKKSLELFDLALVHHKIAIENSQNKASEIFQQKNPQSIQELVSKHTMNQVENLFLLANSAYQIGLESHLDVANIFHQQIADNSALTHQALSSQALSGNPFSKMALTAVKTALDSSHAALSTAKVAAAKTSDIATRSFVKS